MTSRHSRELGWMLDLLADNALLRDGDPAKSGVTGLEHSMQTASRAFRSGVDNELVVVALLHDAAKPLTEVHHGEAIAALLSEYVSLHRLDVLRAHSFFQDAHWNGLRKAPWFTDADRLGAWDAASFDPSYPTLPLSWFIPLLETQYGL